ncbi:hypothetical protein SLS56_007125 [Neofusicoccum ribis]|uniref:Uncharacterized protein n=1 Tax=Neofusicoccum ribis TaxID=45134 RepID=A0ABR3SPA9_9PEZI
MRKKPVRFCCVSALSSFVGFSAVCAAEAASNTADHQSRHFLSINKERQSDFTVLTRLDLLTEPNGLDHSLPILHFLSMTNPVPATRQPVFHISQNPPPIMDPESDTERNFASPPNSRPSRDDDLRSSCEGLTPPYPVTPNNPAAEEQLFEDLEAATTGDQQREIFLDVEPLIEQVRHSMTPDATTLASSPDSDPASITETEQDSTSENATTPATVKTKNPRTKEEALVLALKFKEEYDVYLAKHIAFLDRGTPLSADEQREMEGWVERLKGMKSRIKRAVE